MQGSPHTALQERSSSCSANDLLGLAPSAPREPLPLNSTRVVHFSVAGTHILDGHLLPPRVLASRRGTRTQAP